MVIETGNDERAAIILGRPFLNTSGAVIYASAAKISFYIKGRKETFSFNNKTAQIPEQSTHEPRKRTNRRNRNKQMWTESAKMVTAAQGGQDHRLKSPFLTKKDDLGMPSIHCSINGYNFYKTRHLLINDVPLSSQKTTKLSLNFICDEFVTKTCSSWNERHRLTTVTKYIISS